jgi:hypothetical protein
MKEYLKGKINEHETNSMKMNIIHLCRGTNQFQRGYQVTTDSEKDEKGDLLANSHSILNM